jgi:ribosomal protein S18 acetylase RimI-like enzyme
MIKVNDFEHVQELLSFYLKPSSLYNFYFSSEDYCKLINQRALFYDTFGKNLCWYLKKDGFYRTYFVINKNEDFLEFPTKDIFVTEIIHRDILTNKEINFTKFLLDNKFLKYKKRSQMQCTFENIKFKNEKEIVSVKIADKYEEAVYCQELISKTFDKYTGDVYDLNKLLNDMSNQGILVAYLNKNLVGAVRFENKGKVIYWGHFAVDSNYRGLGIAPKLMQSFFRFANNSQNKVFHMWVEEGNEPAINLYNTIGFKYNGKHTQSLIINN